MNLTVKPLRARLRFTALAHLLGLAIIWIALTPLLPLMPGAGLDPSWQYGLAQGFVNGLVFGRDLVFTFGPFSSVYTKLNHPGIDTFTLALQIFMATSFCAGLFLLFWGRSSSPVVLVVALFIWAVGIDAQFLALPVFVFVLAIRIHLTPPDNGASKPFLAVLTLVSVAMGTLPLIKGSLLVPVVVDAAASVLVLLWKRQHQTAMAIAIPALMGFFGGWLLVGQPLDALPRYVLNTLEISAGYTGAMALQGVPGDVVFVVLAAAALLAYGHFLAWKGQLRWFIGLVMALNLFVAFKAGFVRQDGHIFLTIGFFFLVGMAFTAFGGGIRMLLLAAITTLACTFFWNVTLPTIMARTYQSWHNLVTGLDLRLNRPAELLAMFERANAGIRRSQPLPVVSGSVDIYPVDISVLLANGLNWRPRPVFQSYSAYTEKLARMNRDHLLSDRAPDTIFFSVNPIDGRLPALEDGLSWPLLLSRYSITRVLDNYLQMERTLANPVLLPPESASTMSVSMGDWTNVSSQDAVWARINLQPGLWGRLVAAAFKLPPVTIEVVLKDGSRRERRFIPSMGRVGFLLSPYVGTTTDFALTALGSNGNRVEKFRLKTESPSLWAPKLEVGLASFALPVQTAARDLFFVKPSTPPAAVTTPTGRGECVIDAMEVVPANAGTVVRLNGWASPAASKGIGPDQIWLAVDSDSLPTGFFQARLEARNDVKLHFGFPAMKDPGFSAGLALPSFTGTANLRVIVVSNGQARDCGLVRPLTIAPPPKVSAALLAKPDNLPGGGFVDQLSMGETIKIAGWGMMRHRNGEIFIDSNLPIRTVTATPVNRGDVATHMNDPRLKESGFVVELTLDPTAPKPAAPRLCVWSRDPAFGSHRLMGTAIDGYCKNEPGVQGTK